MQQKEIEQFAFWYLCGKRDRDILQEKEEITFEDYDRLTYIADFLGMSVYSIQIWNQFADKFSKQIQFLEQLYEDTCDIVTYEWDECDYRQHDKWLEEFCNHAPSRKIQKWLKGHVEEQKKSKGIE